MKNRIELAEYFNKLGFKIGAEIGVSDGINAENLCKNIAGLKLYCVDYWEGMQGENRLKKAKERLSGFDTHFIQKRSLDAVRDFKDRALDFVMEDLIEWSKKVRSGGIVSGHDYYHSKRSNIEVIEAVDAYTKAHGLTLNLTTEDPASDDDREPSFWWTKL